MSESLLDVVYAALERARADWRRSMVLSCSTVDPCPFCAHIMMQMERWGMIWPEEWRPHGATEGSEGDSSSA